MSNLLWIVIGDFNDLIRQSEKKGGRPHPNALLHGFANTLDLCGLYDLGMSGYTFTWDRGRGKANWVEERLDHAVTSNSWRLLFRNARLENTNTVCSDHSTIFLDLEANPRKYREMLFRFENAWLKDDECSNLVANCLRSTKWLTFLEQLAECCLEIKQWGSEKYKHFRKNMDELRSKLQKLKWKRSDKEAQEYNNIALQLRRSN